MLFRRATTLPGQSTMVCQTKNDPAAAKNALAQGKKNPWRTNDDAGPKSERSSRNERRRSLRQRHSFPEQQRRFRNQQASLRRNELPETRHIDDEPVLDVAFQHSLIGRIDVIHADHLDV